MSCSNYGQIPVGNNVKLHLLSVSKAKLFAHLSTELHVMAVQAAGASVLSPAEEHWRSITPGQLQSLVLNTDAQRFCCYIFLILVYRSNHPAKQKSSKACALIMQTLLYTRSNIV